MKLKFFELLALAIFIWQCTTSVQCLDSKKCDNIVNLSNIRCSLKKTRCDEIISLDFAESATTYLRSLVCECKCNKYEAKSRCVDKYNGYVITPMIQIKLPETIEQIYEIYAALSKTKATQKEKCEAIQIFTDAIFNIGSYSVGGALTYRDHNNGQSAQNITDTCYSNVLDLMMQDYQRYEKKVPCSKVAQIREIIENNLQSNN